MINRKEIEFYDRIGVSNLQELSVIELLFRFKDSSDVEGLDGLSLLVIQRELNRNRVSVTRQVNRLVDRKIVTKIQLDDPIQLEVGRPVEFLYSLNYRVFRALRDKTFTMADDFALEE